MVDEQSLGPKPLVRTHMLQEIVFGNLWSEEGLGKRRNFPFTWAEPNEEGGRGEADVDIRTNKET